MSSRKSRRWLRAETEATLSGAALLAIPTTRARHGRRTRLARDARCRRCVRFWPTVETSPPIARAHLASKTKYRGVHTAGRREILQRVQRSLLLAALYRGQPQNGYSMAEQEETPRRMALIFRKVEQFRLHRKFPPMFQPRSHRDLELHRADRSIQSWNQLTRASQLEAAARAANVPRRIRTVASC